LLFCAVAQAALLPIARDGKALQPITISANASPAAKQTADELADSLKQITGAAFEVVAGDGSKGIVLGTLAEFPDAALGGPLAIRNTYDGKEAYAIRTEPHRLRLIAATERGLPHAAYRLLEHLGCRWFFPAPAWQVIPRRADLSVELNETDRPVILARRIWWGYGYFDRDRCLKDCQAWARRNRMAGSFSVYCGHAWQSIIARNKKAFDEHPEYLALVKGKRQGEQMCVSNPAVRAFALEHAREHFRRHPDTDMVSLETSDGGGHCECDACVKLGSISERAFGLANEVARNLAREMPGKMVGMLAYNDHCEPPSFPLEPNVYVQSTAGFIRGRYTFDDLVELWPKRCRNLGFYEYLSVWLWDFDMPARGRGSDLGYIRRQIPRYAAAGATSIDCESGNNWGPHGLGYYVANRLMWNPKVDVDALLADFFEKAFGPAAATMRRYYDRLDGGNQPLMSEHLLGLALRDLDEATRQAAGRDDVLARLDHLKQYLHYVRLKWEHDRAPDKDRKRELALATLTHVYRNRFSYMNHWEAIRQSWLPKVAKDYDRPEWDWRDRTKDKPWKVETPSTREETQKAFQDDLAFFRPQEVPEKSFSMDLVRAALPADKPAGLNLRFQGPARYAVYSDGKAIELAVTTGVIAWYRDRPEARYTLSDSAGKPLAQGRLPQDGQAHALSLAVPKAGVYWFEFNDQSAGWGLQVAAGRAVCLALSRGRHPHHMGHMPRMHFFVPVGTKELVYFWEGGPHEVYGPDGKLVVKVDTRGGFVRVAVPAGADGKAWSLGKLCLGKLWFFNAPNYLAPSPDALLVPRELARP